MLKLCFTYERFFYFVILVVFDERLFYEEKENEGCKA